MELYKQGCNYEEYKHEILIFQCWIFLLRDDKVHGIYCYTAQILCLCSHIIGYSFDFFHISLDCRCSKMSFQAEFSPPVSLSYLIMPPLMLFQFSSPTLRDRSCPSSPPLLTEIALSSEVEK